PPMSMTRTFFTWLAQILVAYRFFPGGIACGYLQRVANNLLRFLDDGLQMCLVPEAFRVHFVDVFCAGWPSCKPAIRADDFQAADGRVVTRGTCELRDNSLAGQVRGLDGVWR